MSDILISDLLLLLVEPSSTQRKVIMGYLEELGIVNVDVAESADDAITLMTKVVPDLVISAMHLPDMTGADMLEKMRNTSGLSQIPFLLISSETHYRYLEPIRQAGVIAILPKPFELDQLRSALKASIDFIDPAQLELADISTNDLLVLLVDDSRLARKHIRRVLEDMGVENIIEAENGANAVEIIKDNHCDIIITDYNMPEMDGKEFAEYVRQESNQRSIPILMVTSESDESRLAMVEQVGVSAICDKPFEPNSIRELMINLLAVA